MHKFAGTEETLQTKSTKNQNASMKRKTNSKNWLFRVSYKDTLAGTKTSKYVTRVVLKEGIEEFLRI